MNILRNTCYVNARPCVTFGFPSLAYIDTVCIWVPNPKRAYRRPAILRQLWQLNEHRYIERNRTPQNSSGPAGWYVRLHQPTIDVLQALKQADISATRVDVAFDMAEHHAGYIAHHGIQKYRGKRKMCQYKNSTYWSQNGRTSRNINFYHDRPSKVGADTHGHVEFKFIGSRPVASAGLSHPLAFLSLDLAHLANRQLRMVAIDMDKWKEIEEEWARTIKRTRRGYRRYKIKDIILMERNRMLEQANKVVDVNSWDNVPMQVIYDLFPMYRTALKELVNHAT